MEHNNLLKYLETTLGIILTAISFDLFLAPLKIVVGGTSGFAILIGELFNINPQNIVTIVYIIMVIVNLLFYGFKETKKLLFCSILYPILVTLFENLPNIIVLDYTNKLLHYLLSALLYGLGTGLIFKNGFIGGGLDVLKKILSNTLKIPMGKATFIVDAVLVITGGFIFGVNSVLYAIIIVYISSNVTDRIILGVSNKKMFYIMTKNPDEVRKCIETELKCGITQIDAIGGYTHDKQHMLMTVISTRDYVKLKTRVDEIDKNAFFIITDSYHMYYHGN